MTKEYRGTLDDIGCQHTTNGSHCDVCRVAQGQMSAREFWKTLPHCCGYPDCDGDLVGIEHSVKCPLYGKKEITIFEFAEAFARSQGAASPSLPSAEEVKNRVRDIATKLEVYATMLREEFCKPTNGIAASQALSSDKVSKEENKNG